MPVTWQCSTLLGSLEIDILAPHGARIIGIKMVRSAVALLNRESNMVSQACARERRLLRYSALIYVCTHMYHIIYIIGVDNVYIYIYIYIYIDHLHGAVTLEIDADAVHDLLGTKGTS